jgi:hypothetical protein
MRIDVKNLKVALAHYLPSGGLDDIVAAAGPADLEIVKIDVTASAEAQCETIKDADVLFFVFGEHVELGGIAAFYAVMFSIIGAEYVLTRSYYMLADRD